MNQQLDQTRLFISGHRHLALYARGMVQTRTSLVLLNRWMENNCAR